MKLTTLPLLQSMFNQHGVFEMLGVARIGVFGSFARGTAYNDIDLLLEEEPGRQKKNY